MLKDSHCIISFLCGSDFGMLLTGKTQNKQPGDLPPMVPDLSPPPQHASAKVCGLPPFLRDCLHGLLPAPSLLSYSVFDFIFFSYFSLLGRALD